ncbi:hypothetical protein DSO57_1027024 [Entomophthora muscae]|uniref:Uncharacterized protein n=1 Tax=Entomophthora muscae TaxID=34485 RepID=A0ACC2SR52_9FUNG|nr:hypothetical protein DSO57_1027024 [Entomophthora muscae]
MPVHPDPQHKVTFLCFFLAGGFSRLSYSWRKQFLWQFSILFPGALYWLEMCIHLRAVDPDRQRREGK